MGQSASPLRNVAVVGPHHSGKTTLIESLLALGGAIPRRGSIAEGSTTTDCDPESVARQQSCAVSFAWMPYRDCEITFIDTPGFVDFLEETKLALLGADAALIVVEGDPGRVAQATALVEAIEARKLPHLFVINKLDRPESDFAATLQALREQFGNRVVAEHLPIGQGERFSGYVDLVNQSARTYGQNGTSSAISLPHDLATLARQERAKLLEALGDFDDHLLEELIDGVEPPMDELEHDLADETHRDLVAPVLVAAGSLCYGCDALLDAIVRLCPTPQEAPRVDAEGREIAPDPEGPVIAQICKTIVHPQSGKLSVARLISGTLTGDKPLINLTRGTAKERPGGLFRLSGKKQMPIEKAGPGSLVAIARLENAQTGDTLTSEGTKVLLPSVKVADPVFAVAIRPKDRLDEAKLSQALQRLIDEDPTLRLERAQFTNELLLLGHGEQHVQIASERLSRKYNVKLETHAPTIPYRETIQSGAEVHGRYKHQTGGHGQFGDVWLRIEPRERGHGVTFGEKVVGGVVPRHFIPAVEKGVRDALDRGPLAGYPVIDLDIVLYDGQYHAVDSSEQSFKTAGSLAIREGIPKCSPVLLEPIAKVEVTVPTRYTAGVLSQLTGKRGHILNFTATERTGYDVVSALVPHVEISRYITELRTLTHGLGTYRWEHDHFEIVPAKLAQQVAEMAASGS
ncbi:MAG TPA: elongation factor G [Candidatus Dormibacteraeota bacterium]|nr:elongation factor G [Candidatus Dormibacteraeota bacterium]